jgi:hypothetical protein
MAEEQSEVDPPIPTFKEMLASVGPDAAVRAFARTILRLSEVDSFGPSVTVHAITKFIQDLCTQIRAEDDPPEPVDTPIFGTDGAVEGAALAILRTIISRAGDSAVEIIFAVKEHVSQILARIDCPDKPLTD